MIVEHRFAHIPQDARRGRAWIASLAPLMEVRLDPATPVPVGAFHRYHHLGDAILGDFEAPAQTIKRSESLAVRQALDHLVLRTHGRGRARIDIGGSVGEAGPGDIVLLDLARAIRIEAEASVGVELVLPRRLLADGADGIPVRHGRILGAGLPMIRLLADHLCNLATCLPAPHLVPATLALCRAVLAHTAERGWDGSIDPTGIAIRRFIEANLAVVDAPMLMANFGLSRASLYRAFGGDGGIATYIRDRRLALAMRRLSTAKGRRPMVARLAHECGFASDRVFSRAFHRRYGLWPADVSSSRDDAHLSTPDAAPMAWLREL
ncbi:hypothetical protein ASF53_11800 [Methylobacterium sp. Leaf123]|uniref:helix-turn-helix domain-containing protein n=1 Tax=Methylobacterium sp. Leaf123 TaxID=1736264 RepID=UPI0006F3FAEA|nr:helix-turn-helix domain-containing protein [Methylobacterium sp. Leaf123]KQQ13649.1 hypothetical protein ASF53_11800 [Methylobacterium sp. Leaf123]